MKTTETNKAPHKKLRHYPASARVYHADARTKLIVYRRSPRFSRNPPVNLFLTLRSQFYRFTCQTGYQSWQTLGAENPIQSALVEQLRKERNMSPIIQKTVDELEARQFSGTLQVKFEAGRVLVVRKSEAVKPTIVIQKGGDHNE